ncbi:very low-density lipoprotein receptor-like, partial [Aphelenchoides avenae]
RYGDYRISVPNGLALDTSERRVYWLEKAGQIGIHSADYNGGNFRSSLRSSRIAHPFALAITTCWSFWSDWDYDGIFATSKYSDKTVQVSQLGKVDPLSQPQSENVCEAHSCRCDDFCLPMLRLVTIIAAESG